MFARFHNVFSTDRIVENVKAKLNDLLIQIDSAADRNIKLINDRIRELKFISVEADNKISVLQDYITQVKKMELVKNEISQQERSKKFEEKVYSDVKPVVKNPYSPVNLYQKEQMSYTGKIQPIENIEQDHDVVDKIEMPEEMISVPEIRIADELIKPKKDVKEKVRELKSLGYTVEEIASETGKSTQEVKIILEFS